MALRLARYFGTSPELWLGLQQDFELDVARERRRREWNAKYCHVQVRTAAEVAGPSTADIYPAVESRDMTTPIRVLVAKPGLDGHDRGAKVIAKALRDAGMEVIYTGLRQTPEMIVNAALQEDVQVIGLSMLSGAHNSIVPRVMELLKAKRYDRREGHRGGIIPGDDARDLERQGVAKVFQPGASLESIVATVREAAHQGSATPAVH